MKKMNKLAAAVAVALSLGVAPHINAAPIELKPNGIGDALLFPVFIGYSNFENYFTISNNHNRWVAGHIRFRGAAWSGEILDFPVILSPGDVFVFRIADIDGKGDWAIDQSLDPKNFAYTNQLCADQVLRPDPSYILIPKTVSVAAASGQTAQQASDAVINHHRHAGYVEFFGTAVLDGMTEARMANLLGNDNQLWQNKVANPCNNNSKRGTSVWAWSNAEAGFATDQGLSDVPNVLSGNGFVSITGTNGGPTAVAYNAEALVNFRTPTRYTAETFTTYPVGTHRIENYTRNTATAATHPAAAKAGFNFTAENRAVILYHEDANSSGNATSPAGDYVYRIDDNRSSEARIAFNNTWGPTLADGDDYNLSNRFDTTRGVNVYGGANDLRSFGDATGAKDLDNFESLAHLNMRDDLLGIPNSGSGNSIAEVEEAIRLAGQAYTSVYVDGSWFDKFSKKNATASVAGLKSFYIAHFPTKFYHFERGDVSGNFDSYLVTAINSMLASAKAVNVEVWDIFENIPGGSGCVTSPCIPTVKTTVLGHELNFFSIGFFKNAFSQTSGRVNDNRAAGDAFAAGRVVLSPASGYNDAVNALNLSWPVLAYTFEATPDFSEFGQWRSMQR